MNILIKVSSNWPSSFQRRGLKTDNSLFDIVGPLASCVYLLKHKHFREPYNEHSYKAWFQAQHHFLYLWASCFLCAIPIDKTFFRGTFNEHCNNVWF